MATWIMGLAIVIAGSAALIALRRRPAAGQGSAGIAHNLVHVERTALHVIDHGFG
ncbi:MAG: hypothetical protein JJD97_12190, partial [Gemmatimonadaceae bacterium]|nr:hypothetical protein [Gemmatimonadaceae bacterium]